MSWMPVSDRGSQNLTLPSPDVYTCMYIYLYIYMFIIYLLSICRECTNLISWKVTEANMMWCGCAYACLSNSDHVNCIWWLRSKQMRFWKIICSDSVSSCMMIHITFFSCSLCFQWFRPIRRYSCVSQTGNLAWQNDKMVTQHDVNIQYFKCRLLVNSLRPSDTYMRL